VVGSAGAKPCAATVVSAQTTAASNARFMVSPSLG
jgi:hypothetical protein